MSLVKVSGNASGTGTLTIAAPNTNTDYTLTLPTATTTLVGTDATQTLTNKTIQGGAITSGTAVASTSGTSIDFTGIPSWVKRITVMLNAVASNGSSIFQVQIGTGGTPTTTGYLGSATQISTGVSTAFYTAGFAIWHNVSNQVWSGSMTLVNVSGNIWVASGTFATSAGTTLVCPTGGVLTLGGVLNMVRFTTVNGTDAFNAGSINILYE